jgi:hypothetical protein
MKWLYLIMPLLIVSQMPTFRKLYYIKLTTLGPIFPLAFLIIFDGVQKIVTMSDQRLLSLDSPAYWVGLCLASWELGFQ